MGVDRRRFLSLAAAAAATPFALQLARPQVEVPSTSQGSHFVFPGVQWEVASPVEFGLVDPGTCRSLSTLRHPSACQHGCH